MRLRASRRMAGAAGTLGAALLGAAACLVAASAQAANCTMEPMTLPVRLVEWRPVATVTVNGKPMDMLVDSGAFRSFLSPSTAQELNLTQKMLPFGTHIYGHTGAVEASRTRVKTLGVGAAELKDVDFAVGGNELGHGIQGILGRNILALADTEYDLAHGVVRLVFPKGDCEKVSMAYWAGESPVIVAPFASRGSHSDAALVQVSVNGKRLRALMDTGAPTTSLSLASARDAGVQDRAMIRSGRVGGLGEDKATVWLADIDSFEIGGEKITHQRLAVHDVENDAHDMLLGLDYFLSHRIYVSRLQGKVYATWNGTNVFVKQPGAAENAFDRRYATEPDAVSQDDASALARRGMAASTRGDHAQALKDLDRALALSPAAPDVLTARARVHLQLRQPAAALSDLNEAVRLDDSLVEARLLRAELLASRAKQVAKVDRTPVLDDLKILDQQLAPSSAQRSRLGDVYGELNLVDEAARQYELWLASHENDGHQPRVLNERCWLRTRLGVDLPAAMKDCQRAISKDADAALYRSTLGWLHLRMGDPRRAIAAFNTGVEMEPKLSWAYFGRALAELAVNEDTSAERDLQSARTLRPGIDDLVRKAGFSLPDRLPPPPPKPTNASDTSTSGG